MSTPYVLVGEVYQFGVVYTTVQAASDVRLRRLPACDRCRVDFEPVAIAGDAPRSAMGHKSMKLRRSPRPPLLDHEPHELEPIERFFSDMQLNVSWEVLHEKPCRG